MGRKNLCWTKHGDGRLVIGDVPALIRQKNHIILVSAELNSVEYESPPPPPPMISVVRLFKGKDLDSIKVSDSLIN